MVNHFANKRPGAGGRVEDIDIVIDEIVPEVLFAKPITAFDHESNDFVWRIDNTEPVGGFWVVDLVEVLVNRFQESLLLVMGDDLGSRLADRGVLWFQPFERLKFRIACKECFLKLAQRAGDVIVLMEGSARKNGCEYFSSQDVLDEHFTHVGVHQIGIYCFLRVG